MYLMVRIATGPHVGAFSFNYYKNMACGEGGAFVTSFEDIMHRGSVAVDCYSDQRSVDGVALGVSTEKRA